MSRARVKESNQNKNPRQGLPCWVCDAVSVGFLPYLFPLGIQ